MGGGAATQPRDFCLQNPTAAVCSTEKAIWTWATEHPARRNSRPTHSNKLVVLFSGERQELLDSGSINLEKFQSPIHRMIPADETRPDTVTKRCSCGSFNLRRANTSPTGVVASITKDPSSRRDIFGSGLASTSVSRPATRACR